MIGQNSILPFPFNANLNTSTIIASGIGLVILFITGWYGARLVYQYGVGVNNTFKGG